MIDQCMKRGKQSSSIGNESVVIIYQAKEAESPLEVEVKGIVRNCLHLCVQRPDALGRHMMT